MTNELIVLATCVKGKRRRIAILSLWIFLIVFLVFGVYQYMTVERPQFKDSSYIPLCFLVLTLPFIYFMIRIAIQPKDVMFYNEEENIIYVRGSKGGVFRKGYYVIDVSTLKSIFFVERPPHYNSTILLSLRKDIKDIPGLHFCLKNGAEYVSTDFDDYGEVLAKIYEVLPNEYKHLV